MTRQTSIAALLLCAAALTACEKNGVQELPMAPIAGAQVKFFHFGVNGPAVNFYANDQKMSAISSSTGVESNSGTSYGSAGSAGYYTNIAPGQYNLGARITAVVDNGLSIASIPSTLATGSRYSFYLSGFYNTTTKTQDGFVVEDAFPDTTNYAVALVRFVHAISNANPMTLYALSTTTGLETAVGTAVTYKGAGTFAELPAGAYDLRTRYTGVTTNAITRTNVSFLAGRVYTISARGDITVVSTTATNRPFLDNTANR